MMKEVKDHVKARVGIDRLWKSLTEDLRFILPKIMPNLVTNVEIIEGDGGLGTVVLFTFGPDIPKIPYQKEKIVDFDEALHRIGLQVIEGGYLNLGFSFYQTTIQLTATGDETKANITVAYQNGTEENMPEATTSSTIAFIKSLENYLLSNK